MLIVIHLGARLLPKRESGCDRGIDVLLTHDRDKSRVRMTISSSHNEEGQEKQNDRKELIPALQICQGRERLPFLVVASTQRGISLWLPFGRPGRAYTSEQSINAHPRRDRLLWQPTRGGVFLTAFRSSCDQRT